MQVEGIEADQHASRVRWAGQGSAAAAEAVSGAAEAGQDAFPDRAAQFGPQAAC